MRGEVANGGKLQSRIGGSPRIQFEGINQEKVGRHLTPKAKLDFYGEEKANNATIP
jgi:hypothetical protein